MWDLWREGSHSLYFKGSELEEDTSCFPPHALFSPTETSFFHLPLSLCLLYVQFVMHFMSCMWYFPKNCLPPLIHLKHTYKGLIMSNQYIKIFPHTCGFVEHKHKICKTHCLHYYSSLGYKNSKQPQGQLTISCA